MDEAGCLPVLLSTDFESGDTTGCTTELYDYTTADLWHVTDRDSQSPTHSMWCGDTVTNPTYNTGNQVSTAVITPDINLTASTSAVLVFWESYDTEEYWDYCMVDISIDGGSAWTPLRGGYGSAPSGNSGGWVITLIDLSGFVGNTVNIRFYFDTGDEINNDHPGWFVDDVVIYAD